MPHRDSCVHTFFVLAYPAQCNHTWRVGVQHIMALCSAHADMHATFTAGTIHRTPAGHDLPDKGESSIHDDPTTVCTWHAAPTRHESQVQSANGRNHFAHLTCSSCRGLPARLPVIGPQLHRPEDSLERVITASASSSSCNDAEFSL